MKGQQATEHQKQPASDDNDDDRYTKAWKLYWISRKEKKLPVPLPRSPFPLAPITKLGKGRTPPTISFLKENFENEKNDFLWLASVLSVPIAAENPGDYKKKIGGFAPRKWGICGEGGEAEAVTENSKYLQQKKIQH